MIVEIINTGTELLLGQIINSNAPYLAKKLNELGFSVLFQTTVGDNRERMSQALRTALSRADIIITSGGLGPTQGDITKEVTAQVVNRPLYLHEPSAARIKCFFDERHMEMTNNNLRQAMMPQGAIIVDNDCGTAPGAILEIENKTIIHLPGPPHELKRMFKHSIIPYLKERFGFQGTIVSRVLHTYGLGESALEEKIKAFILAQDNPTIALLARNGEIIIRLTAKGTTESEACQLIARLEKQIRDQIEEYIFGVDAETMEEVAGRMLATRKLTLSLAESCTGGLVTSRITDVAGSSDYLIGSIVCYSNKVKLENVGVPEDLLAQYGAVSQETAVSMATNIRMKFATDIGVGITGIAGPGGATSEKPVGLVFIAISGPAGTQCHQYNFTGERVYIKHRVAQTTLNILRQYILGL